MTEGIPFSNVAAGEALYGDRALAYIDALEEVPGASANWPYLRDQVKQGKPFFAPFAHVFAPLTPESIIAFAETRVLEVPGNKWTFRHASDGSLSPAGEAVAGLIVLLLTDSHGEKVRETVESFVELALSDGLEYTKAEVNERLVELCDAAWKTSELSPSEPTAEVVTLCGSSKFKDDINAENSRLTQEGNVVISLGMFGHTDLPDYNWDTDVTDLKSMLDRLHFQKIRMADRVHVVNPGGYIGESTRREIDYALSLGKPVTYMVEVTA